MKSGVTIVKEKVIIGASEPIKLVDYGDNEIIAKIDTGADTSAIWASSINELDGELSFVLFAPKSSYYTGKVIKTKKYRITNVKNSFGHDEDRYIVKLKIGIRKKIYNATFTLANRENNRYPILLGKRILRGKFVVDASKKVVGNTSKTVVVLVTGVTQKIKAFFDKVEKNLNSELILLSYDDLSYDINEYSQPKISLPDGRDLSDIDFVYFKSYSTHLEQAIAIARYLDYKHVPFFDSEIKQAVSRSKLSEIFTLAIHGVKVPKTTMLVNDNFPSYSEIIDKIGQVFVLKDAFSDRGKNNFIIKNKNDYNEAISLLKDNGVKITLCQQYIENDGFLRVLIMSRDIIQVVKRLPCVHANRLKNHLNKPKGGVNAIELTKLEDYGSNVAVLAQKAAIAMKREVAGVDLIQDANTGQWYILEVNYNPEVVGGVNSNKKAKGLAELLDRKAIQ